MIEQRMMIHSDPRFYLWWFQMFWHSHHRHTVYLSPCSVTAFTPLGYNINYSHTSWWHLSFIILQGRMTFEMKLTSSTDCYLANLSLVFLVQLILQWESSKIRKETTLGVSWPNHQIYTSGGNTYDLISIALWAVCLNNRAPSWAKL